MTPIDYALAALWLTLAIRNKAALLPLFILGIDCIGFVVFHQDFHRWLLTSISYFLASQINITISSSLRNALSLGGLLCLIGATDDAIYQSFEVSTIYYSAMPYFVLMINAYIAMVILSDGGRNIVGVFDAVRRAIVNSRHARL